MPPIARTLAPFAAAALMVTGGLACDRAPATHVLSAEATAPLAAHRELDVPIRPLLQRGAITNCGPTAAAMVLAPFMGRWTLQDRRALRNALGHWSWRAWPARALHIPGHDAGLTTPAMMAAKLDRFAPDGVRFERLRLAGARPSGPGEALTALVRALEAGRAAVALVSSRELWGGGGDGLHWIVVRGFDGTRVRYNDPGDGKVLTLDVDRFTEAWALGYLAPLAHFTPAVAPFTAFVPNRAVPQPRVARAD